MKRNLLTITAFVILTNCVANIIRQNGTPQKTLCGFWSLEGVTWLRVTSDSIYFVDEEDVPPVKYSVDKDTIIWYFDGIIQKSRYNIVKDTLFMENEEGATKYIRVSNL
ncbi:MAG: hypothetical protein IKR18_01960 [Bacteroidaceae bacterium]|nr:hypothetical protein [Bacteroidaceae bacterium]